MNDSLDNEVTEMPETNTDGMSRRGMLLGLGAAAAGAVAGVGLLSTDALAVSTRRASAVAEARPQSSIRPEVVTAPTSGLSYVGIDAQAFVTTGNTERYYQDSTGTGNLGATGGYIYHPLTFPVGTTINTIDVGYQQQPILQILRRPVTQTSPTPAPTDISTPFLPTTGNLPASPGGATASTITFKSPITIEANYSYLLAFLAPPGASVYNAYIGYRLPTQTFVPFTGTTPRVFDSRTTTKFAINEERVVDLGFVGARTAIINLTVTQTATAGFVAVFANGITYPGNSSINWSATDTDIANGVITQVDATGKILVHASNVTHVVIDRIGFLV